MQYDQIRYMSKWKQQRVLSHARLLQHWYSSYHILWLFTTVNSRLFITSATRCHSVSTTSTGGICSFYRTAWLHHPYHLRWRGYVTCFRRCGRGYESWTSIWVAMLVYPIFQSSFLKLPGYLFGEVLHRGHREQYGAVRYFQNFINVTRLLHFQFFRVKILISFTRLKDAADSHHIFALWKGCITKSTPCDVSVNLLRPVLLEQTKFLVTCRRFTVCHSPLFWTVSNDHYSFDSIDLKCYKTISKVYP